MNSTLQGCESKVVVDLAKALRRKGKAELVVSGQCWGSFLTPTYNIMHVLNICVGWGEERTPTDPGTSRLNNINPVPSFTSLRLCENTPCIQSGLRPAIEGGFEFVTVDVDCAERIQVTGWQLAIDHAVVTRLR